MSSKINSSGVIDPYEVIFNKIQPIIANEISNTDAISIYTMCDFCLRAGENFNNKGVIWVDSYKSSNHICETCNLFSEQLPITLGNERGLIGYKFSSFKKGVLAIPFDQAKPAELWIGGKYLLRVNHASEIKIVSCSGNLANYALCESIGQYSVVTEISLRREMFLRHIRASSSADMFISTETGSIHLNACAYSNLKTALLEEDMTDKDLASLVEILNSHKKGRIQTTHKDMQNTLKNLSPKLASALSAIPDPNTLIFILAGFKAGLILDKAKQ